MSITSIISGASNYPKLGGESMSSASTVVPSIESTPTPVASPAKGEEKRKAPKKKSERSFKRVSSMKSLVKKADSDGAFSRETSVDTAVSQEVSTAAKMNDTDRYHVSHCPAD